MVDGRPLRVSVGGATAVVLAVILSLFPGSARAAGVLSVEVASAYNLVVDSNVTSPATYAPKAGYIGARICNTGDAPLANVVANLGDYRGGVGDTPGIFPVTSGGSLPAWLAPTGGYSLTIEADETGAADGARYLGTLAAGACRMQYWLFSYPQCVNVDPDGAGPAPYEPDTPPCAASITGGIKPDDDPSLDYDVWATTTTGGVATAAVTMSFTLRNEISAAANKIWPNTTAKVPDEYLTAIESVLGWGTLGPDGQPLTAGNPVYPGQRVITTQGIWYDLGNVGAGFDNNGDLVPDQNAWLQPVGDPASFDADCFRLVKVYGVVIVKLKTGGELLIPFQDRLYFENLPDNTGVVGLVYYQYIATGSGCTGNLTPYQEAASGFDNEKFSADYGLSLGLASGSYGSKLAFTKTDGVLSVGLGGTLTYTVTADNDPVGGGTGANLGAPDFGAPLVFSETIPAGTKYVGGSAAAGLSAPFGDGTYQQGYVDADGNFDDCAIGFRFSSPASYVVTYSADGGATWSASEPADPTTVTDIRWTLLTTLLLDGGHDGTACVAPDGTYDNGTLETSLPAGKSASLSFQVTVNGSAPLPGPVICNTAGLGFGAADPAATAQDCDVVTGVNTISGTVFKDDATGGGIYGNGTKDGTEAGIGAGVVVSLYHDANGDGQLDGGDLLYASGTTAVDGTYSFTNVADGSFVVAVRKYDGTIAGDGVSNAATDAAFLTEGWGNTTVDPSLPLTTEDGKLLLGENLTTVSLAVNADYTRDTAATVTVPNVNFGFAPPLRVTKTVQNRPDADADGLPDVDEGEEFTYAIRLENRLPSVGRQGPWGCEYTVWAPAGTTGSSPKNFLAPANAWDAASPNGTVATANVDGGGLRWIYGRAFPLAAQPGDIVKVEGLYFGYFDKPLTDDFLSLEASFSGDAAGLNTPKKTATLATSMIDSYVGAPADYDPNSAISWDISLQRPGCTAPCSVGPWDWADIPNLHLLVNADKATKADAKTFSVDAFGVRVTADRDCEANDSTTLSPVPLQDTYDSASFDFVSADPPPTSVDTATGVILWDDVGPIPAGSTRTVLVTLRPRDVNGTVNGTCAFPYTACNRADTSQGGTAYVLYADGRRANNASASVAVEIIGKAELHGTVWYDAPLNNLWPIGGSGSDAGLPGVTVTLYACTKADGTLETGTPNKDCLTATNNNVWALVSRTVTGATGTYDFIGLDSGYYVVEVGDTDGQPASGAGGNANPFGMTTRTQEPDDDQSATGTNADAPTQAAGTFNNTWGNIALNLSALNILTGEETINRVDFGYYAVTAVIAGTVWHDVDADTLRINGEGGLSGFAVTLYDDVNGNGTYDAGTDTFRAATTTDAAGAYWFSGLPTGNYVVVVTPPTLLSQAWAETVESTGGTGSLNDQMPVAIAAAGAVSTGHDFGYTLADTSTVGDTVYLDFDADGFQDPTEVGIPGVTVWLYRDVDRDGFIDAGADERLATDVTDASGTYLFAGLASGSYVVKVDESTLPGGVTATGDPDANRASIGDRVWLDADGDGVQDAGEEGIPGVVVHLRQDTDADGTLDAGEPVVAAVVTDANGYYLFTGLEQGKYFVDVDETTLPGSLLVATLDPIGSVITLAGDTAANQFLGADAGYSLVSNYAIGSRVWSDADGDNVQDPGEAGIPGVRITVTNGTGTGCSPSCTAVTDADGSWFVTGAAGLTNGTFTVEVNNADLPRNFALTAGTDPRTVTVGGADLMSVDFGYRYDTDGNVATEDADDPTGTITGRAYDDLNGNEAWDAGVDAPLAGATVNLLDADGFLVATTTAAADGSYAFTGVFFGAYSVQTVDELGTRYGVLFLAAGATFPNLDVTYGSTRAAAMDGEGAVNVDGTNDFLNVDFGYQRFAGSIGDTVYQDANENATQDVGEPGIGGVTVELYLCGWTDDGDGLYESGEETGCAASVAATTTAADDPLTAADEGGRYLFTNLATPGAGQYYVVRVDTTTLPATSTLVADPDTDGYPCTTLPNPDDPDDEYAPRSVCDSRNLVPSFVEGTNYLGADFGYRIVADGYATVGDRLWVDTNGNGLYDDGEQGIPWITLWFDANNDWDLDWTDTNSNGAWDAGEGERWVETDADGYYLFSGLADGTYDRLRVLNGTVDGDPQLERDPDWPPGLPTTPTYEARATNTGSLDNSVSVIIGAGTVTTLDDGFAGNDPDTCTGCNLSADFGYRYAGANTLSGTICTESGTLDGFCGGTATTPSGVGAGESPLAGVVVSLYLWVDAGTANQAWDAGTGALDGADTFTLLGSTSTNALGDYSFANVPAGKLVVVFSVAESQNLDLTTTDASSSLEPVTTPPDTADSLQLFEGTTIYEGNTVTAFARQAIEVSGSAQDVDFAFDGGLGGAIAYDFGDLPLVDTNLYATVLADGGARHLVPATPTVYLGSGVAANADGQPSDDAGWSPGTGDLNASGATDEDGIYLEQFAESSDGTVVGPLAPGGRLYATASAAGWLAGWIDFNQDGDFADAGEFVVDQAVSPGSSLVEFFIPDGLLNTVLDPRFFARFRIYPSRPLLTSSTGLALDAAFQPVAGEVEDYYWNVAVTRAVVSSFTACEAGGALVVEWRTSSEVGTAGFLLQRRDGASADFLDAAGRVLPSLVGSKRGGTYRFVDRGAAAGLPHEYRLVEIEATGKRIAHGPWAVAAREACDFPADAEFTSAPAPMRPAPTPAAVPVVRAAAPAAPLERAKVVTTVGGIHYLSAADLAAALGIPSEKVRRLLRENGLRLDNRGTGVAVLPTSSYRGAYFFAEPLESSFARDNVYRATVRPAGAVRMASRTEDAAGRGTGEETFLRTVHAEQDAFPAHPLFTDAGLDHWFWEYFYPPEGPKAFPVRADGVAPGHEATLTLLLVGAIESGAELDHHAEVRVNGRPVGEARWNGLASVEARFTIDAGLLADGENTVEIAALGTASPFDVFYLDSLELSYRSRYRAVGNRLSFDAGGNRVLRVSGFTSPDILVFDVTRPSRPVRVKATAFPTGEEEFGFAIRPRRPGARYEALTRAAAVRAGRIVGDLPGKIPTGGVPYLVVTTAALREEAERLARHRGGMVFDIEDIYDEFNHGVASPHALKAFLRSAWQRWRVRPRHVLLAGDGSYDYRDNLGLGGNLIPPMLIGTIDGLSPSDTWFADVAGGPAPEMAVGRLPAETADELRAMIDKVLLREASAVDDWGGRLLALADNTDDAGDFPAGSDRLADLAPAGRVTKVYLDLVKIGKARSALFAGLRAGTGLTNFVGHGGYDLLADEGLLTNDDVPVLGNAGAPTVLTALTCVINDFTLPGYPSLGELLVREPDGGAAAVWAPTGLVRNQLSIQLAERFHVGYHAGGRRRLGDVVLSAMRAYENSGASSTLGLYLLLGDPGMLLR